MTSVTFTGLEPVCTYMFKQDIDFPSFKCKQEHLISCIHLELCDLKGHVNVFGHNGAVLQYKILC